MNLIEGFARWVTGARRDTRDDRMESLKKDSAQTRKDAKENAEDVHHWLEELRRTEEFVRTHDRRRNGR